jgi:predicted Co/Zn/Cd cation transporter (cation efflux family)
MPALSIILTMVAAGYFGTPIGVAALGAAMLYLFGSSDRRHLRQELAALDAHAMLRSATVESLATASAASLVAFVSGQFVSWTCGLLELKLRGAL